MDKKILLFCGKKQTGKSSTAKFLCGLSLYNSKTISEFSQNSEGDLLVPTDEGWGILDLYSKNDDILLWMANNLWQETRIFSFADELKETIHRIFGISRDLLFGSNYEKDTITNIKYRQVCKFIPKKYQEEYKNLKPESYITVRQLLVIFGTYICRYIDNNCWINRIHQDILNSPTELCIIDDCRFQNEYEFFKNLEGVIPILFKDKTMISDQNPSELFDFPEEDFELILDKSTNELLEKNQQVKNYLLSKGLLQVQIK